MLLLTGISGSVLSASQGLLKPTQLIVDSDLLLATHAANKYITRQYATLWSTDSEALARATLAGNFIDETPPEGRRQGPEDAILASKALHQAVPDLYCDIEQMIMAGNRVVSHLYLHGHFTGALGTREGKG